MPLGSDHPYNLPSYFQPPPAAAPAEPSQVVLKVTAQQVSNAKLHAAGHLTTNRAIENINTASVDAGRATGATYLLLGRLKSET